MLSIYYILFTCGSRSAPHKRSTTQETSDDENVGIPRPPRKSVSKRAVGKKKTQVEKPVGKGKKKAPSKKGKEARVNYKTDLSTTDYLLIRQGDW